MKRKMIFALMGIFAIASLVTFAHARPGKRQGMMHPKMMAELNLTEAQKDKLKTLRTTHKKEMVKLQAAVKLAQIELGEVLHQDNPKNAEVKAKIDAANTARNKMTEARIMNRLETKKIFTPEQLKKMEELKSQHRSRKGEKGKHFEHRKSRKHRHNMMPGHLEAPEAPETPASKI